MSGEETSADRNVEIWKIKKLIKSLEMARGYVESLFLLFLLFLKFNRYFSFLYIYVETIIKI